MFLNVTRQKSFEVETCALFLRQRALFCREHDRAARDHVRRVSLAACRGAFNWLYLRGSTSTPAPLGVSRSSPWCRIHRLASKRRARLLPKVERATLDCLQVPINSTARRRTPPSSCRRPAQKLRLTWHRVPAACRSDSDGQREIKRERGGRLREGNNSPRRLFLPLLASSVPTDSTHCCRTWSARCSVLRAAERAERHSEGGGRGDGGCLFYLRVPVLGDAPWQRDINCTLRVAVRNYSPRWCPPLLRLSPLPETL